MKDLLSLTQYKLSIFMNNIFSSLNYSEESIYNILKDSFNYKYFISRKRSIKNDSKNVPVIIEPFIEPDKLETFIVDIVDDHLTPVPRSDPNDVTDIK